MEDRVGHLALAHIFGVALALHAFELHVFSWYFFAQIGHHSRGISNHMAYYARYCHDYGGATLLSACAMKSNAQANQTVAKRHLAQGSGILGVVGWHVHAI